MIERALDVLAHLGLLAAGAFAARGATLMDGWEAVPAAGPDDDLPLLSIIVPARNEERSIERCVRSLLAQTMSRFEVIVVDDRSDDTTAEILAGLQRGDPRLRVVHGEALPAGWVGKPWALEQGVRVASGAWLLFTDADTWHAPAAAASTLAFARAKKIDALSLWLHQELGTQAERAILPTILGLVMVASGSMRRINDPGDASHALANGQYILVSRAAYDALGGHAALRGDIVEDVGFARRLKADGRFQLLLADGSALVRVRMYTSLGELWAGFTKNMYLGARGNLVSLGGAALLLSLLSIVPALLAIDAIARRRPLRALETLGTLAVTVGTEAYLLNRIGISAALAFYAPIGLAATAGIILNSTWRVLGGRGVAWRGRTYTGRVDGERP